MQRQNDTNQNDEIQLVSSPYSFPNRVPIVRKYHIINY